MNRIFWIAWREFLATVSTKGFILGILITPAIIGISIVVLPILLKDAPPKVEGELAVLDPTGDVTDGLAAYLEPEAMVRRREDFKKKVDEATPEAMRRLTAGTGNAAATQKVLEAILGETPKIEVVRLAPEADLEAEKRALTVGSAQDGGRLAVAVIHPDAVEKEPAADGFGSYDLYVREKLDDRLEDAIKAGLREAIIESRVRRSGFNRDEIEALTHVRRAVSITVTESGEQKTNEVLNMLLPAGFMILLLIAVLTSGQQILTTTVEEKSSRVVEVLLSAVSPMQLMSGKIIGQLCVGLVMLVI
ncbi:MAG: ABC transporter permease, partial [Acidobacteria bacterium]|nr:ABC transporter permease [Acidobacteriota bacterium]